MNKDLKHIPSDVEKDLTAEKSMWDIFKLVLKIHSNKVQYLFILCFIIFFSIDAYLIDNYKVLLYSVRNWASLGFQFSITTLGFLIAGFTIFVTISKPGMMLKMAEFRDKKKNMTVLKKNLMPFMKVFFGYWIFSFLYIIILTLGEESGLISRLFIVLEFPNEYKVLLVKSCYVIIGTSFIYLLMLLKSFIFNVYSTVMTFLNWERRTM